jgi:pilus assembly protein FimV
VQPVASPAFDLEPLPAASLPDIEIEDAPAVSHSQRSNSAWKVDLNDVDLDFARGSPAAPQNKDEHWHDVQQKFDLAKAYEEMGDREGARDILREVLAEGDLEQQTLARRLLGALAA